MLLLEFLQSLIPSWSGAPFAVQYWGGSGHFVTKMSRSGNFRSKRDILQSKMSRSGHFRLEMGFITKMSRSGHFGPKMSFTAKMSQSGHFRGKSIDLSQARPSNMLGLGQDLSLAVYPPNLYVLYMYVH